MTRVSRVAIALGVCFATLTMGVCTPVAKAANECDGLTPTILGTSGDDTDLFGTSGPDVVNLLGGNDVFAGASGNDVICGGEGDDSLNGGRGQDRVFGDAGEDDLYGALPGEEIDVEDAGDDLYGGPDFDVLSGRTGDDEVYGEGDADLLIDGPGDDLMDGGPEADTVDFSGSQGGVDVDLAEGSASGLEGEDTLSTIENIFGSEFADSLTGDDGRNLLDGEDGGDFIVGGDGTDTLSYLDGLGGDGPVRVDFEGNGLPGSSLGVSSGADGNDQFDQMENVYGTSEGDTLLGDRNANGVLGFGGDDLVNGRGGTDAAAFAYASGPVRGSLASGVASEPGGRTDLRGIENLEGSFFNDEFSGDAGDNLLFGGLGDDDLFGRNGFDTLVGGPGSDGIFGGAGLLDFASFVDLSQSVDASLAAGSAVSAGETDRMLGIEGLEGTSFPDELTGDSGEDIFSGANGDDEIDGGHGTDFLVFRSTGGPVGPLAIDLDAGTALDESDETAVLGDDLESIEAAAGSPLDDILRGSPGDDLLFGFAGDDEIYAGEGDDGIVGGDGNDLLDGEGGMDLVIYFFESSVSVDLAAGSAQSGGFTDQLISLEAVGGTPGNDTLTGSDEPDVLIGDSGKDRLRGLAGDDVLIGGGFALADPDNPDADVGDLIEIGGKDREIDGGADFDACLGKPQENCETKDLTDEQLDFLRSVAEVIDDIKRKNGVRVN